MANSSAALTYLIWFWVPFMAFAHITVRFIHTLESVEDKWLNYIGLGLFGLQWSLGRFYAILAAEYFPDWHYRILITTVIFYCLTAIQETVPLKRRELFKSSCNESLRPVLKSTLSVRYIIILLVLWAIHGANAKYVYEQDTATQVNMEGLN